MRLVVLTLGAILLGASLAAQLIGGVPAGWITAVAWAQGLGVGLLAGAGAAALSGRSSSEEERGGTARAPGAAGGAGGAAGGGLVHGGAPNRGAPQRAAGHALDASLDPNLEGTIGADHQPMRGVIALPGLANTARETRASGGRGYLHVFTGKNKGESLLLGDQPITLGRDPKNALMLKDEGISQVHAELRVEAGKFLLRDLGSRNGSFINDERIVSRTLEGGDVIGLGEETKILFQAV